MRSPVRVLVALAVVLVTALAGLATPAQATDKELVYGRIAFPQHDSPNVKMLWFDAKWHYLGQQRANGGGYSIRLAPGTYYLQFVDQRPAWDTSKYAPTDIRVTVGSHTVRKSVTMKPGAAITGTARAGSRALANARVVAASQTEQSFATTADKRGRFAVGGLPEGRYCLFTYDKAKRYVDKCTWVGAVKPRQVKDAQVRLTKRAGSLTVFVQTPDGSNAPASTITVTSKTSGQWWTSTVRTGKSAIGGLYPGRYSIKYDGAGIWLTQSGSVRGGVVRAGGPMAFGDFTVAKRGAWIRGSLIDGRPTNGGTYSLVPQPRAPGAVVMLFAADGTKLAETRSNDAGEFKLVGQLTTQSEMTIVVDPSSSAGGFMEGQRVCLFARSEFPGFSVTTGSETSAYDLPVDRDADQPDPACD